MNNNKPENYKNNELQEPDIDEHGKGVLLLLVGIMVLLSFLMVNSYQVPNETLDSEINSKNDTTQSTSKIVNTSDKTDSKSRQVITSNVRMI